VYRRNTGTFYITEPTVFYTKMLNWLEQFNIFCLLHNNQYPNSNNANDIIVAVEALETFTANTQSLAQLNNIDQQKDWLFGHIAYDLKNELENLNSEHTDSIGFATVQFFIPNILIFFNGTSLVIEIANGNAEEIFNAIENTNAHLRSGTTASVSVQAKITKADYIHTINKLKEHIQKGDCYEINFCQEFFCNATIHPVSVFQKLNTLSPNPFGALYKQNNRHLICASPERFLQKKGATLLSQPIKGTIKRDTQEPEKDTALKAALQSNQKERSENVMVVDLVRNDLSKICTPNSVVVEELLGIYSFPQVHHLISSVKGTVAPHTTFKDIIQATFPMGSMTGAPKIKVMQLIEQYETTKRGIFSGALGYINPNGDFDFNVVIRSIMYNATTNYVNYMVGSGITIYCDAEKEYEECLLKAKAMEAVLQNNVIKED
jgi:para-aminobenzoate synthetase component I